MAGHHDLLMGTLIQELQAALMHGDAESLATFRSALLALDREVTGGKLPGLVSWELCPEGKLPEQAPSFFAALFERDGNVTILEWARGEVAELYDWAEGGGFQLRAYLPLRVADALPRPPLDIAAAVDSLTWLELTGDEDAEAFVERLAGEKKPEDR